MSHFTAYYKERFGWDVLMNESGFIVYDIKSPDASIEEFYIEPSKRGTTAAKKLADEVIRIARERGCTKVWAKVVPGFPGSEQAMRTNLHYGFKLIGCRGNDIIIMKEIGQE
jgi:GNAT superfamily N-acetyltransferase